MFLVFMCNSVFEFCFSVAAIKIGSGASDYFLFALLQSTLLITASRWKSKTEHLSLNYSVPCTIPQLDACWFQEIPQLVEVDEQRLHLQCLPQM